jgi:hypothetical protein
MALRVLPDVFRPTGLTAPFLNPMVGQGPEDFSGGSELGGPDAGYWTMGIKLDAAYPDELKRIRGFVTWAQGGLSCFLMPIFDERQRPPGPFDVTLAADVASGATMAVWNVVSGGPFVDGDFFTLAGKYLYQIVGDPVVDGSSVTLQFLPPARAAASSGAAVTLDSPRFAARLADRSAGRQTLARNWYADDIRLDVREWPGEIPEA